MAGNSTEIKIWDGFCLVTFQQNLLSVSLHILALKPHFLSCLLTLNQLDLAQVHYGRQSKAHGAHSI